RGMPAPVCVAKGADHLTFKIREIAKQHDIPIVENVPLARSLYATVDIDEEIPVEHYHAVAEIIGYVMRLKRGFSSRLIGRTGRKCTQKRRINARRACLGLSASGTHGISQKRPRQAVTLSTPAGTHNQPPPEPA